MKKELTLDAIARGPQVDRWLAAAVIAFAAATTAGCSSDVTDEEGTSADAVLSGDGCIDVESSDITLKDAPSGGYRRDEGRRDSQRETPPSSGVKPCLEQPPPAPSAGSPPPPARQPPGDAPSGGWW